MVNNFLVDMALSYVSFNGWTEAYNVKHGLAFDIEARSLDKQMFQHAFMLYMLLLVKSNQGDAEVYTDIAPMLDAKRKPHRDALDAMQSSRSRRALAAKGV